MRPATKIQKKYNIWDFLIMIIIASLAYGSYELLRAIWPIRIVGACGIIFLLTKYNWYKNSFYSGWTAFFMLWGMWIVLSLIWIPDKILGITYTFHMLSMFGAMLLLFYAVKKCHNPLKSITIGWIFFLILTLPIAYWEITTGNHLSSGSFNDGQSLGGIKRIFAAVTFLNLNSFVLMLSYSLPFLAIGMITENYKMKFRLFTFIAYLFVSWVIIVNASRVGFLCLLICTFSIFLCVYNKNKFLGKIVIISIIVGLLLWLFQNWETLELLMQIEQRLNGKSSIFDDQTRLTLWYGGLTAALNTFFMGGGIRSMSYLYETYTTCNIVFAHNMVIELLMEYGLIITILFFYMYYKDLFKIKRNRTPQAIFLFRYVLFSSFFMFVLDESYVAKAGIWIYLGLVIGLAGLTKEKWILMSHNLSSREKMMQRYD